MDRPQATGAAYSPRTRPARSYFQAGKRAARGLPLLISTIAMPLTPLHASHKLPSGVGIMLRTTPPPDGIVQVWNFSVLGSKRTTVLGFTPDSLYQITLPIEVIPYGCDFGPPGEGHSTALPVAGSKRPR